MKARFLLRILAFTKRGVLALESIAKSQSAIAEVQTAATRKKTPRMAEVWTPNVAEQNAEWQRLRDQQIYGGGDDA